MHTRKNRESDQKEKSRRPLTFYIAKTHKKYDRMSQTCYSQDFIIITKEQLVSAVRAEVLLNTQFRRG